MASHSVHFAKFEPNFWLSDPRIRSLSASYRGYYADLWVMTVARGHEVLRGWLEGAKHVWRTNDRRTREIVGRLALPIPGGKPLVKIISPTLLRVYGSAVIHNRRTKGNLIVAPDLDVEADSEVEGDVDSEVDAETAAKAPTTPTATASLTDENQAATAKADEATELTVKAPADEYSVETKGEPATAGKGTAALKETKEQATAPAKHSHGCRGPGHVTNAEREDAQRLKGSVEDRVAERKRDLAKAPPAPRVKQVGLSPTVQKHVDNWRQGKGKKIGVDDFDFG